MFTLSSYVFNECKICSFIGQLLLEERLNCSTLSQEVGVFVELVWTEALGSLSNILTVPVSSISLNDVRMGLDNHVTSNVVFYC